MQLLLQKLHRIILLLFEHTCQTKDTIKNHVAEMRKFPVEKYENLVKPGFFLMFYYNFLLSRCSLMNSAAILLSSGLIFNPSSAGLILNFDNFDKAV